MPNATLTSCIIGPECVDASSTVLHQGDTDQIIEIPVGYALDIKKNLWLVGRQRRVADYVYFSLPDGQGLQGGQESCRLGRPLAGYTLRSKRV